MITCKCLRCAFLEHLNTGKNGKNVNSAQRPFLLVSEWDYDKRRLERARTQAGLQGPLY